MDPHLAKLQDSIADAVSPLTSEQIRWHEPGKWCVAEILEHLYLTYAGTIKGCGRLLETGEPRCSPATFKNRWQSLLVVGFGYMPSGRKSPERALPRGIGGETVVGEIQDKISQMDAALAQCAAQFGPRAKILDHPVLGPFSVAQWRKFHLVHGLHHVKQICGLRERLQRRTEESAQN
jgi:Protein of unknown function (DUF1569)